jgi:cyanate lyase
MPHRLTKVAATTAAATALVAGGYALGTRSDGSAAASRGSGAPAGPYGWRGTHHHTRSLPTLAGKLGVGEPALRSALQALRPQRHPAREEHVAELAKALGIDEAKVRAALDKQRAARRDARIAALANALGLKEADVRAAIEKLGATRHQGAQLRRDAFATRLANQLGIDPAKAKRVLDEFAPRRRERRGGT